MPTLNMSDLICTLRAPGLPDKGIEVLGYVAVPLVFDADGHIVDEPIVEIDGKITEENAQIYLESYIKSEMMKLLSSVESLPVNLRGLQIESP